MLDEIWNCDREHIRKIRGNMLMTFKLFISASNKILVYFFLFIIFFALLFFAYYYSSNAIINLDKNHLVGHAFGEIDGKVYTNSLEGFKQNYSLGIKVFEVDLSVTSDGEVVCFHDGMEKLYGLKNKISDTSLAEFRQSKIYGKYTPLDLHDLIKIMEMYPDIRIITDTKGEITYMLSKIKSAAVMVNPDIMNRIVPQIYNENDYYLLMKIYPFRELIYTLYRADASDIQIADFIKYKKEIKAVTVHTRRFTLNLAKLVNGMGKHVFVHTVNDLWQARLFLNFGAYGFYTDNLHAKIKG